MSSPDAQGSLGKQPSKGTDQSSNDFTMTAGTDITLATLLAKSGIGNAAVHSVDIDVVSTASGVTFVHNGGTIVMQQGASENFSGDDSSGTLEAADDFTLSGATGDVVRIHWVEITA